MKMGGGVVSSIINLIWSHFNVSHLIPKINEVEIGYQGKSLKILKDKIMNTWMDGYVYVCTYT